MFWGIYGIIRDMFEGMLEMFLDGFDPNGEGALKRDLLSSIQQLQERPEAQVTHTEKPATEYDPAVEVDEYLFNLPLKTTNRFFSPVLRLEIRRALERRLLRATPITYFVYRYEAIDEFNLTGEVVDTNKITSRLLLVIEPRLVIPAKITVTEASQTVESQARRWAEFTGVFTEVMVKEKLGRDYTAPEIQARTYTNFQTIDDQRDFARAILTV
jgi:hypothetical protein